MSTKLTPRTTALIFTDTVIIYAGLILALYLRLGVSGVLFQLNEDNGWLKATLATLVYLTALYFFDLYDFTVINNRFELFVLLIQALGTASITLALIFYFVPLLEIGRGTFAYSIVFTLILLLSLRSSLHFVMGHPEIGERVVILGEAEIAIDTMAAVLKRRDAGYRIVGFVTNNFEVIKNRVPEAHNLGRIDNLEKIVTKERIDRIIVALRERRDVFPTEVLLRIRLTGKVSIEECKSFFERITGQIYGDLMRTSWLIFSTRPRETQFKVLFRGIVHRCLGAVGLIASLPIALLTAFLIKLDSKGDIFYRQERVGRNGHVFNVIKFRSMKTDAEADGTPVWAKDDDDRTTRVGRVIRKIRVDEIPQFWNIVKGEMRFVGPRPERPHFVMQLMEEIPNYDLRHLVTPGLTGWAQIKYPYGSSVEDARQKLWYDLYYIKNQSLPLDFVIIFATVKTVLFGRGGR